MYMTWLPSCGALAQLGERNTGSVEVIGSIPLGSTNYMSGDDLHRPPNPAFAGFFVYNVSYVNNMKKLSLYIWNKNEQKNRNNRLRNVWNNAS